MITQFELTDEHESHRESIREFCESEIKPEVKSFERHGKFPGDIVREICRAGFGGVPYPTEYGGNGLDFRSYAITIEEFARAWECLASTINVNCSLVGYPLYEYGTAWQKQDWLHDILSGDAIGALSMTESEAGSDVTSIETTAKRNGDEWIIDGHKVWTTNGEVADFLLVVARTEDDNRISLFGVPQPGERDSVEVVRDIPSMGGDSSLESEIEYHDVRIPQDHLVGEKGNGFRYLMEALDVGRIGTGAQGVGIAQAAFEASRKFADRHEQFGKPIREFQGIGFKLADMQMGIESSRLLTLAAANELDQGRSATKSAAMAKAFATDTAMDVTTEAVQIHGARGYSRDYPVERYMRAAKGMQIYEGTNEINRLVILNEMFDQ